MAAHRLRILHISDLHERVALDWMPAQRKSLIRLQAASRYRVLGETLLPPLHAIRAGGRVDLVCFSGDAADWGQPEEFRRAGQRLDHILQAVAVPRERLFLIPGNHDVNQGVALAAYQGILSLGWGDERQSLSRWLVEASGPPRGVPPEWRDEVLQRTAAFWNWVSADLGREALLPGQGPHGRLGYRVTLTDLGLPFPVHVIGLDSGWLCGGNDDAGKLLLTEGQLDLLTTDEAGEPLTGFRLAMVHHPLGWLADEAEAFRRLGERVDLLLRGHQHEPISEELSDPDRGLRMLAAGSLFEGDAGEKWTNSFHVVTVTLDDAGRPQQYDIEFWGWSPNGHWYRTGAIYRHAPEGRLRWVREGTRWRVAAPDDTHPPPPLAVEPRATFVAREADLAALRAALVGSDAPRRVCSVCGMGGVGKTWLVEQFAATQGAEFPGGLARLVLDPTQTYTAEDLLGRLADTLRVEAGPLPLAERVALVLQAGRPLVHIENVDSQPLADVVTQFIDRLRLGRVAVSGRYTGFERRSDWTPLQLTPFQQDDGVKQLQAELTAGAPPVTPAEQARLVDGLGGLPLALHLAAGYLNAGHTVDTFLTQLERRGLDLRPHAANDSGLSGRTERALAAILDLSLDLFRQAHGADRTAALCALGLAPRAGVGRGLAAALTDLDPADATDLLAAAVDLALVERVPPEERADGAWRVHPLLAARFRARLAEAGRVAAGERLADWFVTRVAEGEEADRAGRWAEASRERLGLIEWLAGLSGAAARAVAVAGYGYARRQGPYRAWMSVAERGLEDDPTDEEKSSLLWGWANLARNAGELDLVLAVAERKAEVDRRMGAERESALTAGLRADILEARGQLDEALRIRQAEQLPVYERLGDVRARAIALGKVADILQARGQLDDALRIRQAEELPVFERLGDVRERAMTMSRIADILEARGQLDEALRIRQAEELPVFERLGDVRSRAVAQGKVADILQARGQLDEALRIRQEEVLPTFERLGDTRELLVGRASLALLLLRRGAPGDAEDALRLLGLARDAARAMRIPEAGQIEAILAKLAGRSRGGR